MYVCMYMYIYMYLCIIYTYIWMYVSIYVYMVIFSNNLLYQNMKLSIRMTHSDVILFDQWS